MKKTDNYKDKSQSVKRIDGSSIRRSDVSINIKRNAMLDIASRSNTKSPANK